MWLVEKNNGNIVDNTFHSLFGYTPFHDFKQRFATLKYIRDKVSLGGFLMIDDFTSIDKNKNSIYKAFNENIDTEDFVYFDSYSNGQIFRRINL